VIEHNIQVLAATHYRRKQFNISIAIKFYAF